ncbi:MAG: FecR domain-containing protein, partial [Verrucomicrobia bacterium]|nr:FecR domain-containing protein [Verrucomicrobiota bacterium]
LGVRIGLIGLGGLLLPASFAQTPPSVPVTPNRNTARIVSVEGQVQLLPFGANRWTTAHTNEIVRAHDRLRTGWKSRAALRLSNQSLLRVNQLSTLEIQPPPVETQPAVLDLRSGAMFLFSRDQPVEAQFQTPQASGAIRGTEFNVEVNDRNQTVVTLLEGAVALNNAQGTVALTSGEQGVVEPGKAPTKSAVINAINVIQWCLDYPGVLDPDELSLSRDRRQALAPSLTAYRAGDLLQAAAAYPNDRAPTDDAERVYRAAVFLAVGQVDETEATLRSLTHPSPLADALREVIAAVKYQTWNRAAIPGTATEWLAESYYEQSRAQLAEALKAARAAVQKSPEFGFAWERVAELEFGFGHTAAALSALEKSLALAPRNAQALTLKGFILSARNRPTAALSYFDQAIAVDGGLGNAWLGRGLCRIHRGDTKGGLRDLQTAVALEPNRALLRSYLGKAFSQARDLPRATRELRRARELDPNDPTAWLYLALLDQEENRVNDAVKALEKSQEQNENRRLFRSRLLLDQDRAVRSVNLASMYQDAGMDDVSVREASRAVDTDYANYSAHLFLANSYEALLDPKEINLRYETPYFSEFLLANLLAPVGAGTLSQNISQQEYSSLFESDGFHLSSDSEYFGNGGWHQTAGQSGTFGNSSYSMDLDFHSDPGFRPNNDFLDTIFYAKIKQQLTPQDSVFVESIYRDFASGDVAQYYNQGAADTTMRAHEIQQPILFAGYHHEWAPGSHTLFLAGRLNDTLDIRDTAATIPFFTRNAAGTVTGVSTPAYDLAYNRIIDAYSTDLQQIEQVQNHTLVAGARYQTGNADTLSQTARGPGTWTESFAPELDRLSFYAYDHWQVVSMVELIGGVSYDRLQYPRDVDTSPITNQTATKDQVSPKAGFILTPWQNGHLRGAYTRSLGGVFFDNSVRLEPVQLAGFTQAFRSLAPESSVGLVPGTRFESWNLAFDQTLPTGTYLGIEGDVADSYGDRLAGAFNGPAGLFGPVTPTATEQTVAYRERALIVTVNQLVGHEWSLGARYQLTDAELNTAAPSLPASAGGLSVFDQATSATLQQAVLFLGYTHPCGVFTQFDSVWSAQSNRHYSPNIPGDDFWQFNVFVGYRFPRRQAELRLGMLNLANRDYQLNPLTLYEELPRKRMLTASLKFNF